MDGHEDMENPKLANGLASHQFQLVGARIIPPACVPTATIGLPTVIVVDS